MTARGRTESVFSSVNSSVGESSGRGQATSIPISMSRGVKYGTRQNRERLLQCQQHSVGETSGRGHETIRSRVAKLTARGRHYEHSFGYLCTSSKHLQLFFRTEKIARFFTHEGASKSSHFSVPNFVTSERFLLVLKSVEMCDQFRVTNFLPGELSVQVHQNTVHYIYIKMHGGTI